MTRVREANKLVGLVNVKAAAETYRQFVELEEKAATIYLQLASRFSTENPDLSGLWFQLAMEEKQHAGLLQFCVAEGLFASDLPQAKEIRKFNALFRSLEKHARDPEIGVTGAFSLACELESSEVNAIYCHLTTPLHRSIYLLRRKIVASPPDHIDRLIAAGKKYGVPATMLKKLDRLKESCANAF
jgi:hypothetical protein